MKKIIIAFIFLLLPMAVLAQSATSPAASHDNLASKISALASSTVVKGAIARCPIIQSKIQIKIGNFDNSKVKHLDIYGQIKTRVQDIVTKLAAQGVDVSGLQVDLQVWDTKVQKFSDDYAIYVGLLKDSQDYVCGKSQGQFVAKLKQAKAALAQVQTDAVGIRTYYAQVLKPDLVKVRNLLNTKATSTPESTATTTADSVQPSASVVPIQ